jgi:hypothetical protein
VPPWPPQVVPQPLTTSEQTALVGEMVQHAPPPQVLLGYAHPFDEQMLA